MTPEKIPHVIIDYPGPAHKDERRALIEVFNNLPGNSLEGFVANQVKIVDVFKDMPLGGHYHDYDELFYLFRGNASFLLEQVDTKVHLNFGLDGGGRVLIPSRVAHRIQKISEGSILIGCTAAPYVSREANDHKYEFK